mgnify:CR=1 FL=1
MTHEFETTESLSLETSFSTLKKENNIKLHVTIGINDEENGWFELYDIETGGDEWYAEGCLRFEDKELIDYDGVFSLPVCILDELKALGYNVENMY